MRGVEMPGVRHVAVEVAHEPAQLVGILDRDQQMVVVALSTTTNLCQTWDC